MAGRLRLFARSRLKDKYSRSLSPKSINIVLLQDLSNASRLHEVLEHVLNCPILRAIDVDDCLNLLTECNVDNVHVFLIVPYQFLDFACRISPDSVPELKHIYAIDNIPHDEELLSDQRLRGIFCEVQQLITTLHEDIGKMSQYYGTGHQYVTENNAVFVWYRFFFNILNRLQHTNTAKREMLTRAHRLCYSQEEHSEVDKFELEYRSDNVIYWYTRESFFYRLINAELRSNDFNNIFSWRAAIHDLDSSLRKLCLEQAELRGCGNITLYRGQQMHIGDLYKLKTNIGNIIMMDTFVSTSNYRAVAEMFFTSDFENNSLFRPVLYEITLVPFHTKAVVASINVLSSMPDEGEYLFSLRTMFRIDQVESIDNLWHIRLRVIDEDDQQFCNIINPWTEAIGERSFFSGRQEQLCVRDLTSENGSFLAFQLLIDIMLRLNQTEFAREEMIEMCRQKYAQSPVDLNKIDEFNRNYCHQDAIKWYTTDSFLHRLLKESLQIENIDSIFKLRYFIYDLHNQLAQLQMSYIESLPSDQSRLTLWRGQRTKMTLLEQLRGNINNFVSMNNFLSTTSDYEAALFFSGHETLDDPEIEVAVIYQIFVDIRVPHSIPFAKIDYQSIFKDEDEVLFSMGSVFHLDEVERYGTLWVVDLTLTNKEDGTWNALTAHLNN